VEAHSDVALRAQVIDLLRLHVVDEVGQLLPRREIAVVEEEVPVAAVRVLINMVDPIGIEGTRTPDYSVYVVAFAKQQFRKVRTVLSGDAGNECAGRHQCLLEPLNFVFLFAFACNSGMNLFFSAAMDRWDGTGVVFPKS